MTTNRPASMREAAKWIKASRQVNAVLSELASVCALLALDLKIESVKLQSGPSDLTQSADSTIEAVMEVKHWLDHLQTAMIDISELLPEGDAMSVMPNSLGESAGILLSNSRTRIARLLRLMPRLGWGMPTVISADDGQDLEYKLRQSLDLLLAAFDVLISELPRLNKAR